MPPLKRRDLLRAALPAMLAAKARATTRPEIKADPLPIVRIGFVGVGHRGTHILKQMLRLDNCRIAAVCDL